MIENSLVGLVLALLFAFLVWIGWAQGHATIAHECEKLGAFYVGTTVYECRVKP